MLLNFRVQNFASLRDEQVLTFEGGRSAGAFHPPAARHPVLPVLAIHGANASGKTNVLQAIQWMSRAVNDSHASWKPGASIPISPFAFGGEGKPTILEAEFLAKGLRWTYGFELTKERVVSEWLYQSDGGRQRHLFERTLDTYRFPNDGRFFRGNNRVIASLTRPNSLFISAAAQNQHSTAADVFGWFSSLLFAAPDDLPLRKDFTIGLLERAGHYKDAIVAALAAADLGIQGVEVSDVDQLKPATRMFELAAEEAGRGGGRRPPPPNQVRYLHQVGSQIAELDEHQESLGTKAWFALLGPVIHTLETGSLLCFDEIDNHLHQLLIEELIELFADPEVNRRNAQLLFTTQRTFDFRPRAYGPKVELLDRYQVWFTEKDRDGATKLFPLSDFDTRKMNLERAYLQGRFGAIPRAALKQTIVNALDQIEHGTTSE